MGNIWYFQHLQGLVDDFIAVQIQSVSVFLPAPAYKLQARLPTVFWQTPSCGNSTAVRIHISEFTRGDQSKSCFVYPLPSAVWYYWKAGWMDG